MPWFDFPSNLLPSLGGWPWRAPPPLSRPVGGRLPRPACPERPFPQGRIKRMIVRAWRQSERAVWPLAVRRGRLFSRGGSHWAAMRESERGSPMTAPRATEDLPPRARLPPASDWRARRKGSSSEGCPVWRAGAPELRCPFPCSFAAGFLGAKRSGSDCLAERAELAAAPGKAVRGRQQLDAASAGLALFRQAAALRQAKQLQGESSGADRSGRGRSLLLILAPNGHLKGL